MQNTRSIPIVPWERYMFADDTERFPMTCHTRFWFDGRFDRQKFAEALQVALQRHPLLSAETRRGWFGRYWQLQPVDIKQHLDWRQAEDPEDWEPQFGPNYRVKFFVRESAQQTLLIIRFHHSVCDGVGIFQVLEDLLLTYDTLVNQVPHRLIEIRLEMLARRGWFHVTVMRILLKWPSQLARILRFFLAWPTTLDLPKPSHDHGSLTPRASLAAVQRLVLSAEETSIAAKAAKARGVTLNDYLLAAFFECLAEQHAARGISAYRIAVPTNLRLDEDVHAPASNIVSMVFLDRTRKQIRDRDRLLSGVAKEMAVIKDRRLGLAMIGVVTVMTWPFNFMRWFLHTPYTQTTAVLTNLGRPFIQSRLMGPDGLLRAGGVSMLGLDTLPPVRNRTRISMSVNGYAGKLSLSARYDSTSLTAGVVDVLLAVYKNCILR